MGNESGRQFHPIRAAVVCCLATWVIASIVQIHHAWRTGWNTTSMMTRSFEIKRRTIDSTAKDGQVPDHTIDYYEFIYARNEYEHPLAQEADYTGVSIHFVGIIHRHDYVSNEGAPIIEQFMLGDLPQDVLDEYKGSKPAWDKALSTIGQNEILLGNSLNAPVPGFVYSNGAVRASFFDRVLLIPILRHVGVNSLILVAVFAVPLYFLGYWFVYRSIVVQRRHVKGRCTRCSYPLPGLLCPECGHTNKPRRRYTNGPY